MIIIDYTTVKRNSKIYVENLDNFNGSRLIVLMRFNVLVLNISLLTGGGKKCNLHIIFILWEYFSLYC